MTDALTILPPNATALERSLDTAGAARLDAVPVPVGTLWRPESCPAALLPWLAWALSVDTWDATWPDSIQRQVIAASIEVHRHKGTLGAVKRALAALGLTAEVTEWWQEDPPGEPYTFSITALVNANLDALPFDLAGQHAVLETVTRAKNVRSHFGLRFGVEVGRHLTVGGSGLPLARFAGRGRASVSYGGRAAMAAGASSLSATRLRAHGVARARDRFSVSATLALQAYQGARTTVYFQESAP